MVMPGENILNGADPDCSECGVDALTRIEVLSNGAGFCIETYCDCGPFSRESLYLNERDRAEEIAAEASAAVASAGPDIEERIGALRAVLESHLVTRG